MLHSIKRKVQYNIFKILISFSKKYSIDPHQTTGITTILTHEHVLFFLLSIKSFFYWTKIQLPVYVVDDGTLTEEDVSLLEQHIIGIQVCTAKIAKKRIRKILRGYHYCSRYRLEKNDEYVAHTKKLFDPIFLCPFDRFILMDSDVIFYSRPDEIIRWISSGAPVSLYMSYKKRFIKFEHRWQVLAVKILSKLWESNITPFFNSGIYCVGARRNMQLPYIEQYTQKIYDFFLQREQLGDQLILSLAADFQQKQEKRQFLKSLSPIKYAVLTDDMVRENIFFKGAIHYHATTKRYIYEDGIKMLIKTRLFYDRICRVCRRSIITLL